MKLRSNSRIGGERAHPDRNLRAIRPGTTKKARAADGAKCFDRALAFPIDAKQLFSFQQVEMLLPHPRLGANRRSGMFPAPFAVAVAGADEWRFDFKTNTAAETTASDFPAHIMTRLRRSLRARARC